MERYYGKPASTPHIVDSGRASDRNFVWGFDEKQTGFYWFWTFSFAQKCVFYKKSLRLVWSVMLSCFTTFESDSSGICFRAL